MLSLILDPLQPRSSQRTPPSPALPRLLLSATVSPSASPPLPSVLPTLPPTLTHLLPVCSSFRLIHTCPSADLHSSPLQDRPPSKFSFTCSLQITISSAVCGDSCLTSLVSMSITIATDLIPDADLHLHVLCHTSPLSHSPQDVCSVAQVNL